jgi:hypothetical protein
LKRLTLAVLAILSCSNGSGRLYDNNDLQLATGYTAKELCSCLFVMEMDEAYCRNWTRASPAVTQYKIDEANKSVETTALLQWGARAHFDSAKFGCVLEN